MLRGRDDEVKVVAALLDAARKGTSGALVVRGEPGIGKTALLEHAADQATGMRVLRAAGIESEAELPFAGLTMLLGPVRDRVAALPSAQRAALAAPFGLDGDRAGSGDRFMTGAGVLSLVADLAEETPVLCLVDDAQWVDHTSVEALLFAARRLDREGVVMLFGVRDYAAALAGTGLPELALDGLPATDATALLDDAAGDLSASARDQLVAETGGNPLALLELATLPAVQGSPLSPLPLTSRVLDAFHHQVRALPAAGQRLLLLAAADDTGDLATLLRAAAELRLDATDLEPAEANGLVTVGGDAVRFRHPLVRAAAYHGAPLGQRIAAHRALATAYAGHRDADRRAWHLAVATTGPTEEVARELAEAAARAVELGGHAAAAAAYERAAQLSEDTGAADLRLTLACEAGLHSGRLDWARSRAERALPTVTDIGLRIRLVEVCAGVAFVQGALREAHELLTSAVPLLAPDARDRAFWLLLEAVHAAWAAPNNERLIADTVDAFATFDLADDDPLAAVAWLVRWATAVPLGRDTAGFPPLAEVVPRAVAAASAVGPRSLVRIGTMTFAVGLDRESAEIAGSLVADARAAGTIFALPGGLGHLTIAQTLLGEHREAWISGTEGMRIAADTDQPIWVNYTAGALVRLAAVEGDEARCRDYAAAGGQDHAAGMQAPGWTLTQTGLALLDLGAGRIRQAHDRLAGLATGPTRHQGVVVRSAVDQVEAAARLGDLDAAASARTRFEAWASAMRHPWSDALLARCHALTAAPGDAEERYRRAVDLHAKDERPFDRARTDLLFGEWLRRERRKAEARDRLSAALRTFEELGSTPWSARARSELDATGATTSTSGPRPSSTFAALTPQELQITQLAATGMSNRDIAARLYLSPKTVAYHLYKAYPKLGISSRAELRTLVAASG